MKIIKSMMIVKLPKLILIFYVLSHILTTLNFKKKWLYFLKLVIIFIAIKWWNVYSILKIRRKGGDRVINDDYRLSLSIRKDR